MIHAPHKDRFVGRLGIFGVRPGKVLPWSLGNREELAVERIVERVQLGVRMEKHMVQVLKGLA